MNANTRHKGNEAQRHKVIQGKEAIGKEARGNTGRLEKGEYIF